MVNEMKNIKIGAYTRNDEVLNFNFATDLSAYRKLIFVNYVVNSLIDEDRYDSIIRDMVFDFGIVSIFTDIDTSFINSTDNDGRVINPIIFIEPFLEETNVVDIVKANMEVGLLEELEKAVDKSIEYRTGIHPSPLGDAIASLANTLEKKVKEVDLNSMMGMAQKFANMTGELTPESVINAYINSGAHKQNLDEIAEAKRDKKNEIKIDEDLGEAIRAVAEENKVENKSKSKSKN